MGLAVFNIIVLFSFVCYSQELEDVKYYWRDYDGVVPDDAVPGGYDLNNRTTYIGKGFLKNDGIIPATIYPGQKYIVVPMFGVKTVNSCVSILCSRHLDSFKWVPVKANEYHADMANKHVVLGGVQIGIEKHYPLRIARTSFYGEVVVGKAVQFSPRLPDLVPMYFVHNGAEKRTDFYELLVYNDTSFSNLIQ